METHEILRERAPDYGRPAAAAKTDDQDQRFLLHGISWEQYEALLGILGDKAGLRLTYSQGTLEFMSPSRRHEYTKTLFGRLLEIYALDRDIDLEGYGSTTFRKEVVERGLEPDECYVIGGELKEVPDIAFEAALTSGFIDKLDVYRGLGIPEVWFWKNGRFRIFRLGAEGYAERERSEFLPELDLAALGRFVEMPHQTQAVRAWRDWLSRPKR